MLLVGIGGMCGAVLRYILGLWMTSSSQTSWPLGTWIINMSGSLALGVLSALHINQALPSEMWLLLGTGLLGAYTTFSTFGYETLQLLLHREKRKAAIYIAASVIIGVLCAAVGFQVGRFLLL